MRARQFFRQFVSRDGFTHIEQLRLIRAISSFLKFPHSLRLLISNDAQLKLRKITTKDAARLEQIFNSFVPAQTTDEDHSGALVFLYCLWRETSGIYSGMDDRNGVMG